MRNFHICKTGFLLASLFILTHASPNSKSPETTKEAKGDLKDNESRSSSRSQIVEENYLSFFAGFLQKPEGTKLDFDCLDKNLFNYEAIQSGFLSFVKEKSYSTQLEKQLQGPVFLKMMETLKECGKHWLKDGKEMTSLSEKIKRTMDFFGELPNQDILNFQNVLEKIERNLEREQEKVSLGLKLQNHWGFGKLVREIMEEFIGQNAMLLRVPGKGNSVLIRNGPGANLTETIEALKGKKKGSGAFGRSQMEPRDNERLRDKKKPTLKDKKEDLKEKKDL